MSNVEAEDVIKSTNISWSEAVISREERERMNGHRAAVVWLTGFSGSGKSTLARSVERVLFKMGCQACVLDGDNIRYGLNKNLGFSPEDREENIRRIGEVANLFSETGVIALTAFISPYRADRDKARAVVEACGGSFLEIHVDCSLDVCEQRDTKGLYRKAWAGEIKEFTGVSAPYEEPLAPEFTVDTTRESVEESTRRVITLLRQKGIIK